MHKGKSAMGNCSKQDKVGVSKEKTCHINCIANMCSLWVTIYENSTMGRLFY